jgi:hypothetical protein
MERPDLASRDLCAQAAEWLRKLKTKAEQGSAKIKARNSRA